MTKNKEIRVSDIEVRQADNEPVLVGYAVKWDSPTTIGGQFQEAFTRGAFSKSLVDGDVRALIDHNTSQVLGRTKSGTLKLEEDDVGLRVTISPPDTTTAQDLMKLIKRGDVSGMSFGFKATKQEWDHRSNPSIRTVTEAQLFETSVVTFPAYPDTEIGLRSLRQDKAGELKLKIQSQLTERKIS